MHYRAGHSREQVLHGNCVRSRPDVVFRGAALPAIRRSPFYDGETHCTLSARTPNNTTRATAAGETSYAAIKAAGGVASRSKRGAAAEGVSTHAANVTTVGEQQSVLSSGAAEQQSDAGAGAGT